MSILSFGSIMETVVVTADLGSDLCELFNKLCGKKNCLARFVYNLALRKSEDRVVLLPQMGGGVELAIRKICNADAIEGIEVPFSDEAMYIEAKVLSEFQPDHGASMASEFNLLEVGETIILVCWLNQEGHEAKGYLLETRGWGFYNQLLEVESASRASSSPDEEANGAKPEPVAESVDSAVPPAKPPVLPAPASGGPMDGMLSQDEINALLNGVDQGDGQNGEQKQEEASVSEQANQVDDEFEVPDPVAAED